MSSLTRFRRSCSPSCSLASSSAPSSPRLPLLLPRTSSRPQPPHAPRPQHNTSYIHTTGHRRPSSTTTTSTIAPSLSANASTAFHRSAASPDLAAAKRTARGRGGRSSSRGRRGRSDPDDHPPSNGATSFVFATPPSSAPTEIDQQRERLLRRLNEISHEKRKLEQTQQTSSSLNGASPAAATVAVGPTTNSNHIHHQNNTTTTANVALSSSTPPLANNNHNPIPPNNSSAPLPASADSPHHHHSYHNNSIHYNDDIDHPRGPQIHQYPHHSRHHHDLSRDDIRKDDVSSEDASKPYHHSSSYKPRASSSGISGVSPPPHSSRKQPLPSLPSAPPVVPSSSAPQKRRRGDLRDPPADSDAPTAGHVDGSESPPRMHPHHDHSNRNGKHAASKTRASSTSVIPTASAHGAAKSTSNYPLSSPSPSPPLPPPAPPSSSLAAAGAAQHQHSSAHSLSHALPQLPQPIDLDRVIGGVGAPPLHSAASKDPGDRSRSRQSATASGRAGSTAAGSLPGSSPQGSPNLLSARGSGRVRTPSVLLSSHPGEKTGGLGGAGGAGSSGHAKNRQVTFCLRLIKDMIRLKDGVAFAKPIDQLWTVEQLPGYFDVIKQPMDLGTIRDRLEGNWYMKTKGKQEVEEVVFDLDSFKSDTRLVFINARTYNRPGDMFYEAATRLMEKFEAKMKHVPSASELTHQASKKSSKKRKKSSSTVGSMLGSVTSSGVGSASDPIVVHDSITTGTGGSGRKNESSKKRRVSKGDANENGRASRTSKKKPPIPSGVGAGGTGGKSRGSIGGGSSSKKKKGSSGAGSRASGGPGSSVGGPAMARSNSADLEVVEVKPHHVNKQDTMSVADMEVRLRALKRQRSLLESGAPASPPTGSSTSYKAQAQALYHVEMTYQEKVQLSTNVGRLPADKLRRIVALATKNKSSSMEVTHNDNEEIELDIDSMNNETLREMEAYVNQILSKGKKKGSGSALTTSPNADLLSMTMDQVNAEIEKLTAVLHKGDADNGDEIDGKKKKSNKSTNSNKGNNSNLNKKSHNSNTHNNSKTKNEPDGISHVDMKDGPLNNANSKSQGQSHGSGANSKNKKTSFYDESSSGSDSDDSGSGSGSESSDDDSSSDDSDSSDEDDDESDRDGGDEETQRKRRERNLAHQQAMQQAAGTTPLPSPGYQGSQRSC